MKSRSTKKSEKKLLTVWMPKALMPFLDAGVRIEDSDRSKFIRSAIREKLAHHDALEK